MRALRDFNLPKIVTNDVAIFLGLINDLFPLVEVPRKRDVKLEQMVRQSIAELCLQPEENFILKVEIMAFCLVYCTNRVIEGCNDHCCLMFMLFSIWLMPLIAMAINKVFTALSLPSFFQED